MSTDAKKNLTKLPSLSEALCLSPPSLCLLGSVHLELSASQESHNRFDSSLYNSRTDHAYTHVQTQRDVQSIAAITSCPFRSSSVTCALIWEPWEPWPCGSVPPWLRNQSSALVPRPTSTSQHGSKKPPPPATTHLSASTCHQISPSQERLRSTKQHNSGCLHAAQRL